MCSPRVAFAAGIPSHKRAARRATSKSDDGTLRRGHEEEGARPRRWSSLRTPSTATDASGGFPLTPHQRPDGSCNPWERARRGPTGGKPPRPSYGLALDGAVQKGAHPVEGAGEVPPYTTDTSHGTKADQHGCRNGWVCDTAPPLRMCTRPCTKEQHRQIPI